MGRKKRRNENPEKKRASPFAILFGIVWVGGWTVLVACADWAWGTSVINQLQSLNFPTVPGQVVSSEVVEEPGDESVLYRPDVKYGYVVGKNEFVGHHISQWRESSSFKKEARKVVADYPVGKPVTVYYSARDPSHAVLEPGFHPNNLLVALPLVSFNLIAIGSLAVACGSLMRSEKRKPWEISVRQANEGTRVRVYAIHPALGAGIVLFLLCFLTAIPAFFASQIAPREILVAGAWAVVLIGTGYAWVRARNSGSLIELDDMEQTLRLSREPAKKGDDIPLSETIGFREIITVRSVRKPPSEGDDSDDESPRFQPTLIVRASEGGQREVPLAEASEQNARWLSSWLRTRLGIAG